MRINKKKSENISIIGPSQESSGSHAHGKSISLKQSAIQSSMKKGGISKPSSSKCSEVEGAVIRVLDEMEYQDEYNQEWSVQKSVLDKHVVA